MNTFYYATTCTGRRAAASEHRTQNLASCNFLCNYYSVSAFLKWSYIELVGYFQRALFTKVFLLNLLLFW